MPEGTDIKVISEDLNILNGQKLIRINNIAGKFVDNQLKLPGYCVSGMPFSHGKNLFLPIDCGGATYYIHIHLMLTGGISIIDHKYTKVSIEFEHITLYLYDTTNRIKIGIIDEDEFIEVMNKLGPDILDISRESFLQILEEKHRTQVGNLLVKQNILAGIGLYLRSDILYHARIYPWRKISTLTMDEKNQLYDSMHYVYMRVIKRGGSKKYKRIDGTPGKYSYMIYNKDYNNDENILYMKKTYYNPDVQI